MSPEQWDAFVLAAETSTEWTNSDAEWLQAILQTKSAQRLFGVLFELLRQHERTISLQELITDGGRLVAIQKQGEMRGVMLALDTVRSLTERSGAAEEEEQ